MWNGLDRVGYRTRWFMGSIQFGIVGNCLWFKCGMGGSELGIVLDGLWVRYSLESLDTACGSNVVQMWIKCGMRRWMELEIYRWRTMKPWVARELSMGKSRITKVTAVSSIRVRFLHGQKVRLRSL